VPAINRRSFFLLALCAVALLAALVLWLRPAWLVTFTGWEEERWQLISFFTVVTCGIVALVVVLWGIMTYYLQPTEFAQKRDIIQLIAQTLGGATLLITLFSTWQGVRENKDKIEQQRIDSERTMKIAQLTLDETRHKQLAEHYSRAADQLGSKDRGTRIASIYALGQLASDSDEFYWPIIQMLTSYIAENALWRGDAARPADQIPSDVQAAMNVLARRKKRWHPPNGVLLPDILAREIDACSKRCETNTCKDKDISETDKCKNKCKDKCKDVHPPREVCPPEGGDSDVLELRGLDLRGLILKNKDGDLESGAQFEGAKLDRVRLDGGATNLRGIHLEHAVLFGANLRGAYMSGAYLYDADLKDADVHGTDFSRAKGLERDQIMNAKNFKCAKLDEELRQEVKNELERIFTIQCSREQDVKGCVEKKLERDFTCPDDKK
jgi:hypothetical protein